MCVLRVEAIPPALRGNVSRWMVEVAAGVWVGRPSARVREGIWNRIKAHADSGSAVLIVADGSELGAAMRVHGDPHRILLDFDGIDLPARPRQRRPPPR
jgi:CRISPR-associated protein Cas2